MKRSIVLFVLLLSMIPCPNHAQSRIPSPDPGYQFSFPGMGSLLGFANPAAVNSIHGWETLFLYSADGTNPLTYDGWAFLGGMKHLGFSAIRTWYKYPEWSTDSELHVSDYRISLGLGGENAGVGFGYGWSGSDRKGWAHDPVWTAGTLWRPNPYVSLGLSGLFSARHDDWWALADLALRPTGSDRLTLFGDVWYVDDNNRYDTHWAAGLLLQPVDGFYLSCRVLDEGWSLGLHWDWGRVGFRMQPGFDGGKIRKTVYGMRLGSQKRAVWNRFQKDKVLELDLKGEVRYQRFLILDEGPTLAGVLETLNQCVEDSRISCVVLNCTAVSLSTEMAWELHKQILRVREHGKKVIAFLERPGMNVYYMASAADFVVLDPEGMITLEGFVQGRTYLKGTLEKIGLGFEEWRFFKYKSAAEDYARTSMSDADREQRQALVDARYELLRGDVAASRSLTLEQFDRIVDEHALLDPGEALQMGLVDKLGRWSDLKEILKANKESGIRLGPGELEGELYPPRRWGERPKIALVYALGICDVNQGIRARSLERHLLKLAEDKAVHAVVIRVDSPGGDGMASDMVSEAMKKIREKKPLVVSQGSVAGSGGYWISMEADTILAAPNTVTGSIGVIGGWIWNNGLGEKLGMTSDHVRRGKHADLTFGIQLPLIPVSIPDRNLDEEEHVRMEKLIRASYGRFVRKVAAGRGMKEEDVEHIAQGRVWSGIAGKDNGLVDLIGGLDRAIEVAKEMAGLLKETEVDIVEYPAPGWFDPTMLFPSVPLIRAGDVPPVWETVDMLLRYPGRPLYMVHPDLWER